MKNIFLVIVGLTLFLWLFSCNQGSTYMPPADAAVKSGHFLLFYNELHATDSQAPEISQPTVIKVDIIQEGGSILSDEVDAGSWNLYPVPEGVYIVKLEIEYHDQPIRLKRSFTSKINTINALNVDLLQVKPSKLKPDVQTSKATFDGETVTTVLNAKREGKPLTYEDVQRFESGN